MESLLKQIKAAGYLNFDSLIPDGRFHLSEDDCTWYVCFRNFSPKTSEEFYTVVCGDWSRFLIPLELCSLADVTSGDRIVISKNYKRAHKIEEKNRKELKNKNQELIDGQTLDDIKKFTDSGIEPPSEPAGIAIFPLGFKEKEYFFTSTQNRQIVSIQKFSESDMLGLAPLSYWETVFPGSGAQRVDWTLAKSTIMEQARQRGIFQPRNVRGAGVWNDEGRIVVNMGDHLVVDGERVELGDIKARYFYTLGNSLAGLHPDAMTSEECDVLMRACSTFKWRKSDHGYLLAGALVVSRVCGALPVRPHVWITGGASTGKSTLLEKLIYPILGENFLYVAGGTTEAGIRQSLRADAVPVLFDEFETTGLKSAENVAAVVELLRSAWSDSSALIVKGGAGGNATAYQVRCSAIVSSIRTKLTNDADRQRFAIVELAPHGSDADHWKELSSLLAKIDREYGERLFARTISLVPVLLQNFKILKKTLAGRVGARFGDQYGMLLAGVAILMQDDVINQEQADFLADKIRLDEEKEEAAVTDHDNALNHLLTKRVLIEVMIGENSYQARLDKREFALAEAISRARGDVRIKEALQRLGIKVESDYVAIASSHNELEATVYRGTQWSQTWANSLARIPGSERNKQVWMAGRNQKSVRIPGRVFWGDSPSQS